MKPRYYILARLVSSRGTDESVCLPVYEGYSNKETADEWAERVIAGSAIESCTVSYRRIKMPTKRRELTKRWDAACKRYAKAKLERETVLALLNAFDRV